MRNQLLLRLLPALCLHVLLLFAYGAHAQQEVYADSLLTEIEGTTEDSTKIRLLLRLTGVYANNKPKLSIQYGHQALVIAKKNDSRKDIAAAHNSIGVNLIKQGETDEAAIHLSQALEIAQSENLADRIPDYLNNVGLVHATRGDWNEAMKYYNLALNLLEQSNASEEDIASLSNNIGVILSDQGNSKRALPYFERFLKIQEDIKDSLGISIGLTNIGECNYELGEKTIALKYYRDALNISEIIKDEFGIGYLLTNIGIIHFDRKEYNLAEGYFTQSMEVAEELGYNEGKIRIYTMLAKIEQINKDYTKANDYCQKGLVLAKAMGIKRLYKELYEIHAQNYELKGDFKQSLKYYRLYKSANDSLFNEEKNRQIAELSIQYETRQKEAENKLLKEEQIKNELLIQRRTAIGWTVALFLVLVSLIAYSLYRRNQRKYRYNKLLKIEVAERTKELKTSNTQLEKSNKELEQFAYITSHDLKEPLRNIVSFTSLIERNLEGKVDPETKDYMSIVQGNVRQMHSLIEGVLEYARIKNVDFNKEAVDLNQVAVKIETILSTTLKENNVEFKFDSLHTVNANAAQLFLVLKNLVENAIKYNKNKKPVLQISSKLIANDYHIEVKDNGIGIAKEYHSSIFTMFKRLHDHDSYKGAGLGLSICRKIIQNFGGDIWVESELGKGSRFIFSIPVTTEKHK